MCLCVCLQVGYNFYIKMQQTNKKKKEIWKYENKQAIKIKSLTKKN